MTPGSSCIKKNDRLMAGLGGMKSNSEPGMIDPIFINSSFNLEFDVSFVDTPFDSGEG